MENYHLSAKEILQKEFKQKMRGYDPIEVDEFLDSIIKDYEQYNRELIELREENERLVAKVDQLTRSTETLSRIRQESPKQTTTVTNFDIIKRLSNLEKEVFGKKLAEKEADVSEPEVSETKIETTPLTSTVEEDLEQTKQF
ncbi:cell division regulator GpsB [Vagococcus xieshaowenii]|uniref:Cell cycle protein GpsB n=1 Tax=Vagococcus xieshaowenii TaxID=2562451 RepID=A0AAJ5EEM6_9ENTE|nr:cell division regulator GpsB [Vagococcus xieshaowenii]QCA28575.1 cell division regulator GpsB [Vagococcus xieshaowenii]TFZ40617.1 cell division regulator GpsB [Vagococcus xieshaowenii]